MGDDEFGLLELLNNSNDEDETPQFFQHSPYYNTEGIGDFLSAPNNAGFKIFLLNCQSLNSKFSELKTYIEGVFESKFDAICLQETWLSSSSDVSLLQLEGYNLISKGKLASNHGGVAIYLKDTYTYKVLSVDSPSNIWDGVFIEVSLNGSGSNSIKNLIIGSIYRPPRDNNDNYATFIEEQEQILHNFQRSNKEVVLTGDFNIDLLKIKEKSNFNSFFETILSNGFIPKITFPTRITNHSSTLIDNIFVKLSNNFSSTTSGILLTNISDHFPCFTCLDYLTPGKHSDKFIKIWPRSEQAYHNFKTEIAHSCIIDNFDKNPLADPNYNYEILHSGIQLAYEKHIPAKIVKFNKHRHKLSKWITGGLLSSIRFRDKLYKRMKDNFNNPDLYVTLRSNLSSYNSILKKLIREAKKSYYESCFRKFKDDISKTWDTIKAIINRTRKFKEFPQSFLINGTYISDTTTIANEFNSYFVSIGPKLATNIESPANLSFRDYLQTPFHGSFHFEKVNVDLISKIIDNLKAKSSSGVDNLSNRMLKFIKDDIIIPLTLIINQAIDTGVFPNRLKVAKVIPLFKKNEDYLLENYRPISVLPSMSKVLERVIHIQLTNHFSSNNLFYCNQYGFRNSHSTELASLEFVNRIINCMDKNEIPLAVYLDLSKAFDTIDHQILLSKLQYYGIRDSSYKLIQNYLYNRKQYTSLDNVDSSLLSIQTGVPQGSILGPLFFIIYINDLPSASKVFHPIIYADDTTLSTVLRAFDRSGLDIDTSINAELNNVSNWLKVNKLSLNSSKTKAMLFHTVRKNVTFPNISINGTPIEFVESFDYLGIIIDKNLSWKAHISKISVKLSKTIGIMCKMKNILSKDILLTLYHSLFLPYLNYGLLCWQSKVKDIFKLQKKAIRILACEKYNAHTDPLFKRFRLLKLSDIVSLQELKFCYKLENDILPTYFLSNLYTRNSSIHQHSTRSANFFRIPRVKHEYAKQSIQYIIPVAYNTCVAPIREKIYTHSLFGFAKYVKQYFISNYNEVCETRNCYVCQSL
jgi:hypothetical protein